LGGNTRLEAMDRMSNFKYKDEMSQGEIDLLMQELDALETAYVEADLFLDMARQESLNNDSESLNQLNLSQPPKNG
jgi:hypothetical protein